MCAGLQTHQSPSSSSPFPRPCFFVFVGTVGGRNGFVLEIVGVVGVVTLVVVIGAMGTGVGSVHESTMNAAAMTMMATRPAAATANFLVRLIGGLGPRAGAAAVRSIGGSGDVMNIVDGRYGPKSFTLRLDSAAFISSAVPKRH